MKISRKLIGQLVEMVLEGGAKRATKYLSPQETVKVTYQGKRDARNHQHTLLLTMGRINDAERKFIQRARQAGEPFPIKKVQLYWTRGERPENRA